MEAKEYNPIICLEGHESSSDTAVKYCPACKHRDSDDNTCIGTQVLKTVMQDFNKMFR